MLQQRPLVVPTEVPPTEVPFSALERTNLPFKGPILREIAELIDRSEFTNGPSVAAFEQAFAEFCETDLCVGLASGLDALRLGLIAAGVRPGDEVIVPGSTFIATYEAVTQAGAIPVPVDVSERDYCLDVTAAAAAIGPRTRAILPVHLYGQMADMLSVYGLAQAYGLLVLEDACQAHGALRNRIHPGELSTAAAFSFYPSKNLGALGDAGALVTNDPGLARTARALREHGQHTKYGHDYVGYTSRLDTLQAVALVQKLRHLRRWNHERAVAARLYTELLAELPELLLPPTAPDSRPVWHLYVVRTQRRDALRAHLASRGIGCAVHYPQPPALSAAYAALGRRPGTLPVSEALSRECLSLPLYPGITQVEQRAVVSSITDFFVDGQ